MPAPPYSCGTEMPSSPSFAIPPRMRSRSKWCWRSVSRMCGATSRAPHSRTDCSSRRCSSFKLKSIMGAGHIGRVGRVRPGRAGGSHSSPSTRPARSAPPARNKAPNRITRGGRRARARRARDRAPRPRSRRWRRSRDDRCCRRARTPRPAPRRRRSTPPSTPGACRHGSRARPPAVVSNVLRSMFVIRLPKRSTRSDLDRRSDPRRPRAAAAPGVRSRRPGRPSAVRSIPFASHAAAGAKRSRPSNVRLTVGRAYSALGQLDDSLRRHARRAPPSSTPLSGATNL